MMKSFTFQIEGKPDHFAGDLGFTDTVVITVESGNLGDEMMEKGFIIIMKDALSEWYDTPHVTLSNGV